MRKFLQAEEYKVAPLDLTLGWVPNPDQAARSWLLGFAAASRRPGEKISQHQDPRWAEQAPGAIEPLGVHGCSEGWDKDKSERRPGHAAERKEEATGKAWETRKEMISSLILPNKQPLGS